MAESLQSRPHTHTHALTHTHVYAYTYLLTVTDMHASFTHAVGPEVAGFAAFVSHFRD